MEPQARSACATLLGRNFSDWLSGACNRSLASRSLSDPGLRKDLPFNISRYHARLVKPDDRLQHYELLHERDRWLDFTVIGDGITLIRGADLAGRAIRSRPRMRIVIDGAQRQPWCLGRGR